VVPGVSPVSPSLAGPALSGMALAGEGFSVNLSGDWRAKVEETWDGARRREIRTTVPIARQFMLALVAADRVGSSARPSTAGSPAPGPAAGNRPVQAITVSVVVGQMKFDRSVIAVRAGQRVEITLVNGDDMQHNLVIFARGPMAMYEKELFGSMNEPNAQLRGFVPDSPNVLAASRLLNAGESTVLAFDAPSVPGDYPFVCSFPGHWLTMRGVLRVD
jgi:azurin